jgi:hypothetical protein
MVPGNPAILSHMADPREYTVARTLQRNLATLYNGGGRHAVSLNAAMPPSPVGWACQPQRLFHLEQRAVPALAVGAHAGAA